MIYTMKHILLRNKKLSETQNIKVSEIYFPTHLTPKYRHLFKPTNQQVNIIVENFDNTSPPTIMSLEAGGISMK